MTSSSTFISSGGGVTGSSSSFWESAASVAATNPLQISTNQNQHCSIGGGYTADLASSYNAIWEHHHNHHHHHHHGVTPAVPYRAEFFPGFACSTEFWHPTQSTPSPINTMPINNDAYRASSTNAVTLHRSSSNKHSGNSSSSNSSQKKSRRRVATYAQRRAANIRERRRMFNLNEAFDKLRRKVPTFAYEKRLSRIETLRLAITYISFMDEILNGTPSLTGDGPASSMYQIQNQRDYVPYVIL